MTADKPTSPNRIKQIFHETPELRSLTVCERLRFWAGRFIGSPYIESPLGEGKNVPRLRFDGFDCMTYVETCRALTISEKFDEILPNLDRIRYRRGDIHFHSRNHFVSADWLPNNSRLIERRDDLSDSHIIRTIDRAAFFADKGNPLPSGHFLSEPQKIDMPFVSREKLFRPGECDVNCALALFVGDADWIIVTHMGLLFFDKELSLFHASSRAKSVVKVRLSDYLRSRESVAGSIIASIHMPEEKIPER